MSLVNKTLGIIGAGQLGMMLTEAAKKKGLKTIVLDPNPFSPAFRVADDYINRSFSDLDAVIELCERSDIVTYEFENVDDEIISEVSEKYCIPQGNKPLYYSKNRLREKRLANTCHIPTAPFQSVRRKEDLIKGLKQFGYPCILKTTEDGYDGKGQFLIHSEEDLPGAYEFINIHCMLMECILEKVVPFDFEVSTISFRSLDDSFTMLPIVRNIHQNGILNITIAPASLSLIQEKKIKEASRAFMEQNNFYGIMTIEFFVLGDDIYFNEMAPRPHNSGHYSIEACPYSQYDLLIMSLLGEKLPEKIEVTPCIMKNILGKNMWFVEKIKKMNLKDVYIHMYNKKDVMPNRKMGHITFLGYDLETYKNNIEKDI